MKAELSPTHTLHIENHRILWFQPSNNYVVVSDTLGLLIDFYLKSKNETSFVSHLVKNFSVTETLANQYFSDITTFLHDSSQRLKIDEQDIPKHELPNMKLMAIYAIAEKHIQVNYENDTLKRLIHPQFEHFHVMKSDQVDVTFDIFKKENHLFLYKNRKMVKAVNSSDFHLLQGQFAIELLNTIYNKTEADWIATLHASTIANEKEAIMLIGDSGNGKSTLSALLMANGFDVVADDFTPLLAENLHIYRYPSAISVKEGAFQILEQSNPSLKDIPTVKNPNKSIDVKYIPTCDDFGSMAKHFPCRTVIYVQYDSSAKSTLSRCPAEKILQTLIPDSWISPEMKNSRLFLDWLSTLSLYELNYSDNDFAIDAISDLFD